VAFPLVDILSITEEPLLTPKYRVTHIWAERFLYGTNGRY
jgi:hypothetical protein